MLDVANFDPDFTNEEAQDSVVTDSALSETVQDQFRCVCYRSRSGPYLTISKGASPTIQQMSTLVRA